MRQYREILTVLHVEHLKPSMYGNPKQALLLDYHGVYRFKGVTATNAVCGYYQFKTGEKYRFTYHYTAKGNVIIDYFEEVKNNEN